MTSHESDGRAAGGGAASDRAASQRGVVPRLLATLAAIALGLIFLFAAFIKAADMALFSEQVASYGIVDGAAARMTALILVPFEALLGASLVVGFRRRLAAAATGALVVLFIILTAWAWSQGRSESCGCFGSLSAARGPGEVIVEDLVFLGLALVTFFTARRGAGPSRSTALKGAIATGCALVALVFAHLAPGLPIDDYVTMLRPGSSASELGFGHVFEGGAPGIGALVDLESDTIDETVAALNTLSSSGSLPPIAAFAAADETERGRFFWQHGPMFEIHETAADAMRPLYRKLPRFFLVVGDRVVSTWNDGAPTPAQVVDALASSTDASDRGETADPASSAE